MPELLMTTAPCLNSVPVRVVPASRLQAVCVPVRRLRLLAMLVIALGLVAALPAAVRADVDPGSNELLAQNLYTGNLGIPTRAQLKLGAVLDATAKAGAELRVAVIATRGALGPDASLWANPQGYADKLGQDLAPVYTGRLLVVMPNGFGVSWNAEPARAAALRATLARAPAPSAATAGALTTATAAAIDRVELAAGVKPSTLAPFVRRAAGPAGVREAVGAGSGPADAAARGAGQPHSGNGNASTRRGTVPGSRHELPGGVLLAVLIALLLLYVGWRRGWLRELLRRAGSWSPRRSGLPRSFRLSPLALIPTLLLVGVVVVLVVTDRGAPGPPPVNAALATNPHIDPGTRLTPRPAPGFTLTDQTGRSVSLRQFRGKVVLLAFVDPECTDICPLTTTAMLDAKAALGKAGKAVQLLGVNANWKSTQVDDVLNYTELHGMRGRWQFLTGSVPVLTQVWKHYGVDEHEFASDTISHVAAMYLIDRRGRLRESMTTYPSYTSVPQVGQLLAQQISALLPGHPPVRAHYSYAERREIPPTRHTALARLGGGRLELGPGKPHFYLFFATWDRQSTAVAAHLDELNAYAHAAERRGLPSLAAIDEGSVEPSPRALPEFIKTLRQPLRYPVAIDRTGAVADGYDVTGEPWIVLVNAAGKVVWYREVDTQNWPTLDQLAQAAHNDLGPASTPPGPGVDATAKLAGSPAPLAALHAQASKLVPGGQAALDARIRALHGYPIVVNMWGSWCIPCQKESGLFATASSQYGKRVAFLGADINDPAPDGSAFLHEHHVSYPSYGVSSTSVDKILVGGLQGTPTTVFIDPDGHLGYVHLGQFTSQGALDTAIQNHALDHLR